MLSNHNGRRTPELNAEGLYVEPATDWFSKQTFVRVVGILLALGFFVICWRLSEVNLSQLMEGLPRLFKWASKVWPPQTNEIGIMLLRAAETVAIATVATTVATLVAFPLSIFISKNIRPSNSIAIPLRLVINAFRGVDTVVFAILFVAAVGLGPFAGVLGMLVHSVGVIAKLNSEAIETVPQAPIDATAMTGARRSSVIVWGLFPSVFPNLASTSLYVWEANVRTSTILGIVGAGGIGIEIKAAIDLLDFSRLFTLTAIVLLMVTIIDQFSAWLRSRLV
ncbi:MAG: phosphonate ABC transporter, permease protein PhnE [Burkholderiaceae bacterium]|nr:phosphonate ABC transporter, permease protein PhnE [Burkholderiaceae bacterium]MCD8538100.1 phosphonate ABC transporter, permease protein PhnE [Burkholderiaceae bacterium]